MWQDSATMLYYARNRWYDPSLQRFLSRDASREGNRYVYAANNPTLMVDPIGNSPAIPEPIERTGEEMLTVLQIIADMEGKFHQGCHTAAPYIDQLGKASYVASALELDQAIKSLTAGGGMVGTGLLLDSSGGGAVLGVPITAVGATTVAKGGAQIIVSGVLVISGHALVSLAKTLGSGPAGPAQGQAGEAYIKNLGTSKNTDSFNIGTGGRIPDIWDELLKLFGDCKNVKVLARTAQMRDYLAYFKTLQAQDKKWLFVLIVKAGNGTRITAPLLKELNSVGAIIYRVVK